MNFTPGEVTAGVGAVVVDDEDVAAIKEYRELKAADFNVFPLSFMKLIEIAK